MHDKNSEHTIPTVPFAEYLNISPKISFPNGKRGRPRPEMHITFRMNEGSFVPTTRALTLNQAKRLRDDINKAIQDLQAHGF